MITGDPTKPLIVQSDRSLLLDVHNPEADAARVDISPFTELEKSPEHMHTYRLTPLSIWNAASAGWNENRIEKALSKWSRFPVPENVSYEIGDLISRFGKISLHETDEDLVLFLKVDDPNLRSELYSSRKIVKLLDHTDGGFLINLIDRGHIKQELMNIGYPVRDEAPLVKGDPLEFNLREMTLGGYPFHLRDYQEEAARIFHGNGNPGSGFGTVVLPCGSGKTIIGMAIMKLLATNTLILSTNVAAVHQWIDELLDKTTLTREEIGEYSGTRKEIKPVTIGTYQVLTWRPDKEAAFPHFSIFRKRNWGLIIYDEVHLLPAPVFRITAEIQAVRRLGLTATLIREDGKEGEVFSLVGPKRYDVPWKELEAKGWIAEAYCHEIRVDLAESLQVKYAIAAKRHKHRIASENPLKIPIAKQLTENHREDAILVIGQYLNQLKEIADTLKAPLITGKTPNQKREDLYQAFREGRERILVVSKVANFAIDLPDASVAIQVSGTFGSRQEEAQRLGRILRPKKRNSYFYSLVTRYTVEELFAANRQKFLTEQGYKYYIESWNEQSNY
ncbi:MAG: DEAD/DEAH box helicase [Spirochaetales bacterium]|nr:DEAD/DEAH box helicase [Spirochaetales bacterium]